MKPFLPQQFLDRNEARLLANYRSELTDIRVWDEFYKEPIRVIPDMIYLEFRARFSLEKLWDTNMPMGTPAFINRFWCWL
jgi:hypothetical protein